MLNQNINAKAAVAAILISVMWGGNTPSIKVALEGMPPLALAGVRFILGALTVLAWILVARIQLKPSREELRLFFSLLVLFKIILNTGMVSLFMMKNLALAV